MARLSAFIDPKDSSESTSRLLIWQALRMYSVKALIKMLSEPEIEVRTIAARELHIRGGRSVWKLARALCASNKVGDRIMGLFILSQLGTPRLPYREESLELIESLFKRKQPAIVMEQALYAVGHLREGEPLKNPNLLQRIKDLKVRRGSDLAAAKTFALRG